MLRMHRDGLIELPPPTCVKGPQKKIEFTANTNPQDPVVRPVNQLPLRYIITAGKQIVALN